MISAAGDEIGALYINTRQAIPVCRLLDETSLKQSATPIQTDNTTALGFVMKNLNPKATKSEDMNYWRMRDKQDQGHFSYYWGSGKRNDGDYQTKHHCASHHQQVRRRHIMYSYCLFGVN